MTSIDASTFAPPQPLRDRLGRYVIGGKPWTRATTVADVLDDRYNLEKWGKRMLAKGLTVRDDLHALASTLDPDRDRTELNRLCDQAVEAAKTVDKAGLGTALHRMTEAVDRGASIDTVPTVWRPHVTTYVDTLRHACIEIDPTGIEQILTYGHPDAETRIAGTADRLPVTWQGKRYVADLKTGANLEWSWRSIAIQLAIYANHNGTYDPATDKTGPRVDVETDQAIVIHLPAVVDGPPTCALYMVDTKAGHDALLLALEVREWRTTKGLATVLASHHQTTGTPTEWVRQRIQTVAAAPAALARLRATWPAVVPQPVPNALTGEQIDALDACLAAVETAHQLPFPPARPGGKGPATTTKRTRTKAAA